MTRLGQLPQDLRPGVSALRHSLERAYSRQRRRRRRVRKAKCADRRASPGAPAHGLDVDDQGNGTVTESRMSQLIREPELIEGRQFEVEFPDEGMEAYSVTCG